MNKHQIQQAMQRGHGNIVRVLHEAVILHEGWEMDNRGWVVELDDGTIKALTTNHGGICEWTLAEMQESIDEAERSAVSIAAAMKLLAEKGEG